MCKLIPFKRWHLDSLYDQPINQGIKAWCISDDAKLMEGLDSVTVLFDGEVMLCGGLSLIWHGRAHVWSVFSADSKTHFIPVIRTIKSWLEEKLQSKYQRIEMSVAWNFMQGHRRARLLGFEMETARARKYTPGGDDCSIYSLVRRD